MEIFIPATMVLYWNRAEVYDDGNPDSQVHGANMGNIALLSSLAIV